MSNTPARTRLDVDVRRAQLLEHALELFSTKSFDDVSISEVARVAGVSQGLLYHYFPGKRALFVASLEVAAKQLLDEAIVEDIPQPDASPAERYQALVRGLDNYLQFVEQRSEAYRFLMRGGFASDPDVQRVVNTTRDAFIERITAGMGAEPTDPGPRYMGVGWAATVEQVSLAWLDTQDVSRAEMVEILAKAGLRLLAPLSVAP